MTQAKDISDEAIVAAITRALQPWGTAMLPDICDQLPGYPWKVVLAKLRSAYKRKLIDGCPCGCRGDFQVTTQSLSHRPCRDDPTPTTSDQHP